MNKKRIQGTGYKVPGTGFRVKGTGYREENNGNLVHRKDFIVIIIRTGLLFLLGAVTFFLSGRISKANNCGSCPGNGICKGETDCSIFLSENK